MSNQVFDSLKGQSAKLLDPSRELNKLAIAKLEQLTSMQFSSMRDYFDLNLAQLKAATNISSPEVLQAYLRQQQEYLRTVGEKLAADAQALATLGKEFTAEAKKIAIKGFTPNS